MHLSRNKKATIEITCMRESMVSSCSKSFAIQLVAHCHLMSMLCLMDCETNLTAAYADPRD